MHIFYTVVDAIYRNTFAFQIVATRGIDYASLTAIGKFLHTSNMDQLCFFGGDGIGPFFPIFEQLFCLIILPTILYLGYKTKNYIDYLVEFLLIILGGFMFIAIASGLSSFTCNVQFYSFFHVPILIIFFIIGSLCFLFFRLNECRLDDSLKMKLAKWKQDGQEIVPFTSQKIKKWTPENNKKIPNVTIEMLDKWRHDEGPRIHFSSEKFKIWKPKESNDTKVTLPSNDVVVTGGE